MPQRIKQGCYNMNNRLLTLFLLLTSGFANASAPTQDFSQEPLVQRCMGMLDIYRNEDFDAYVAAFPEPWLGIFGEKVLKNELSARHQKYMNTYQGKPASIVIEGIDPVEPTKIEKERLGAVEGKEVSIEISNERDTSSSTSCKFLRIGENWYFRELRL